MRSGRDENRDDIHVHVNLSGFEARLDRIEHAIRHLPTGGTDPTVQQTLERIENKMSALSDAISAAVTRVVNAISAIAAKLDEALGNDAADDATIAALQAEVDALKAEAAEAVAALANLAPDPDEPPVEPPEI